MMDRREYHTTSYIITAQLRIFFLGKSTFYLIKYELNKNLEGSYEGTEVTNNVTKLSKNK